MVGVRLLQTIIILLIIGVVLYLLQLSHALKKEKRLAPFAISSREDEEIPLMDRIGSFIWKINKWLAKYLKKSVVFSNYGEKYNKYILYEERSKKDGIDYVAGKFLLAFAIIILVSLSMIIEKAKISLMVLLIIFLVSFFIPDVFLHYVYMKKRKRIEEDLLVAITIMNSAFKSGRNIMQAIEIVKNELDGPIKDEFKKIYLDITYGLSLDVVFKRFYERVRLEDAKYITSSLTLLNKTGGDIIKVFSLIEKSFFDKKNLKNELNSLTASSQFVFKFLMVLPFLFIMIIFILNPSYFTPLFTTTLGIIILILTILLYILYILIIKRVLEVEI